MKMPKKITEQTYNRMRRKKYLEIIKSDDMDMIDIGEALDMATNYMEKYVKDNGIKVCKSLPKRDYLVLTASQWETVVHAENRTEALQIGKRWCRDTGERFVNVRLMRR